MNTPVFLLAATGGLAEPSFASFLDLEEAEKVFNEWEKFFLVYPGDRVDLMKIEGKSTVIIASVVSNAEVDFS